MSGLVPNAGSLADIYPESSLLGQAPRWNKLLEEFQRIYGHTADFVARSPGRVNIIGEHIDYSLYSCLPMAITADAIIAVSSKPVQDGASTFNVKISNLQAGKFPSAEFDIPVDGEVDIDSVKFEWTNYFKSGLKGGLQSLRKSKGAGFKPVNLEVLMDGNVPVGGGLSSSAAFTSASALAVLTANGVSAVNKKELTELAIISERSVGVNSGGLDQSASVLSERGSALFVSFSPSLVARPVKFPPTNPELCFIIAQSFVTSNKHVTGPIHYNLRVVECSLAAAYLNAVSNPSTVRLPEDHGPLGTSLQGFHDTYFYHHAEDAAKTISKEEELKKLIVLTEQTLTREEGYSREEIAQILNISVPDLESKYMSKFPIRADRFKLRQRALHVFSEALRVIQFLTLLERPVHTGATDTTAFNKELGALLNKTQESCRELYECSCPELDDICKIARAAGAYGSRLTGAGWGGCSVHMVPVDRVAAVKEALENEYYSKRDLTPEQKEQAVVVSRPSTGASVYIVNDGIR